jgi:hypothetical protein
VQVLSFEGVLPSLQALPTVAHVEHAVASLLITLDDKVRIEHLGSHIVVGSPDLVHCLHRLQQSESRPLPAMLTAQCEARRRAFG